MTSLRVLTWNVDGLNETRLGQRMERLCLEMLLGGDLRGAIEGKATAPMPDVIALQEVVKVGHRAYFNPHLTAAGFTVWPAATPDEREYYELIAVRAPWTIAACERRQFEDSPLRRALTLATLKHGVTGREIAFATGHLESLASGSESRVAQVREIATWMHAAGSPAVFAGDTNLREAEWASVADAVQLRDAWTEAGRPADASWTWRPESGSPRMRFDRVWLAGKVSARSVAGRNSPKNSDHRGLEATLQIED